MSIVIISLTENIMTVLSDSKMSGETKRTTAPKIYQYSPALAMYGVGNAGVVLGFFNVLDNIRNDIKHGFNYQDAIQLIYQWKQHVEASSEYAGHFGAIGVCGINNNVPQATTVLIDAKDHLTYCNVTDPNKGLSFYIIPPTDLSNDVCNAAFITNCLNIQHPLDQQTLIEISSKTLVGLSHHSDQIDDAVQYWSYDLRHKTVKSQLLDFSKWLHNR